MDPRRRMLLKVVVEHDAREETADTVERLMGNKPEARFVFIQERAPYAGELVDL
jgi:topoisomerase-4 subunit B